MLPRVSNINLIYFIMVVYKVTNIGVKDPRSLAKVLDVSNRKDTVIKLRELIKSYAEPADD